MAHLQDAFDVVDVALARIAGVVGPVFGVEGDQLGQMASWLVTKKAKTLEAVIDEMRSSTAKPALLLPREPSLSMVDVALPSDDLLMDRYQHGVSAQGLFVASRHLLISGE